LDTESAMRKALWTLLITLGCIQLQGCMQVALRASPALFPNFAASIFEECDPELAKASIPPNLKLMILRTKRS
jgi:hypothetical protein